MSAYTVVSLGDLVVDLVTTIDHLPVEAGEHQLADQVSLEPGGAGNFLIAGARLGMQMEALGAIGADPFGKVALEVLQAEGVDVEGAISSPGSTTTTVIVLVDRAGGHVFLGKYGEGPVVEFPDVWARKIRGAQAAFSYGYSIQEERQSEACLEGMRQARSLGIPVFFDPGPEMARVTLQQRRAVLACANVLLMTEEEIPLLADRSSGLSAARRLLERGSEMVCIKQGPRGCRIFTKADEADHPGFPVPMRDTAGAGDSFAAAFIYAYLHGWPLDKIAAFANAMGAAKVQKLGSGRQVPTAGEVQVVLDQFGVELKVE